ncbi:MULTISPECIES: serine/threonine-protein kinase [unclassified Kitasatospora]|uniref:serine/threonine-protein kinase n=1 Tax=unclassified Kitasatospora TaxID=2633591 RepID=UPI0033D49A39
MEPLGDSDPRRIGSYRLLGRLGAGGMGRVYLGRTEGGRTVAVKVVRGELADDAEFRARFRQEVAAARRVGSRWTAPVLDADTEGDPPWVAGGYVAGPSLDAAVRRHGPLPVPAVHALGAALAEALAAVHGLGLVHRDVKPSNVLLALDGPRLIDFGIARALDAATALTRSGYLVGSPGYLSPEQAAGEPAGPAGDVFSLGAVLAFAATGVPPFGEGVSAAVLLYRVLHEQPDLGGLTGALHGAVRACLARTPADRPSPDELRALLSPGAAPLADGGWLPPAVSAEVARSAVELLDLEAEAEVPAGAAEPVAERVAESGRDRAPTHLDRPAPPVPPGRPGSAGSSGQPGSSGERVGAGTGATAPAPRSRGRRPLVAAAAVLVVLAAGGVLWQTVWRDRPGDHVSQDATGAPPASADPPVSANPSTPANPSTSANPSASVAPLPGTLPAGYLGTWRGTITTAVGGLPSTFTVSFAPGKVGEVVGQTANASAFSSTVCRGELTLLSVTPDRIELQEHPKGSDQGCTGVSEQQAYTPAGPGAIHLKVTGQPLGMDPSGDLAKQG